MKFLTDQDVFQKTTNLLRNLGHDVITATDLGMSRAEDSELLQTAHDQERIFVTRDRDFGSLVFSAGAKAGILYLRIAPSTLDAVHAELERVLTSFTAENLLATFIVIEPGCHRVRKPAP